MTKPLALSLRSTRVASTAMFTTLAGGAREYSSWCSAVVSNAQRPNALLVPQQGIARDPRGNTTAMVVDKEGKVELRPVVVNRTIGAFWLVDQGLVAGDRVVVEGLQKIAPGVQVEATEAPPDREPGPAPDQQAPEPANGQPKAEPGAR